MYSVLLSKIEFVFPLIKDRLKKIVNENMKVIVMPWAFPTELDYDRLVNEYFKEGEKKILLKHNVDLEENFVGSLGPIMVSPDYVGHGLQREMMNVLVNYCRSINKKYIFTKVCSDNVYSLNNMLKCDFKVVDQYINERGSNTALIKKLEK